ncbi:MAG: HD domain-containing protein [Bacteroidales bacterium]
MTTKRKIINDPVHGFITVSGGIVFEIIDSAWFQRLRRIKQLGLTHLVYPGALHTRFHHALGAMHLMREAIETLRSKGHTITTEEEEGALFAILLHDMGHGPFSHALEYTLVEGVSHEAISLLFMERLNAKYHGALDIAIEIFRGTYPKSFLHQLVSGQLDVDRLDYLKRDSFFTGVSEGVIGTERIIKMLNVVDDQLVIEQKGIYSVEKFLLARRLMYWQVYLHKTVLAAESMLIQILRRARDLARNGGQLFATPPLARFLRGDMDGKTLADPGVLECFALLDDFDLITSVKTWAEHPDPVLSKLAGMLISRSLFRCELQHDPFPRQFTDTKVRIAMQQLDCTAEEALFFVYTDITTNSAYTPDSGPIMILMKDGSVKSLSEVSDQLDISYHSQMVSKHYCCYPKGKD